MATAATETARKSAEGPFRPSEIPPAHADGPRPYRMTVEIYERIVEAGVFGDTSPVFLWKGQLVLPMTKGPNHENALAAAMACLFRLVPDGWHVRVGSPVRIRDDSEPEPDLVVLRGTVRDYARRTAGAGDVAMAAEVADSSLRFDSGSKLESYAAAGLPVYWIVNVPRNRVEVYSNPSGPASSPSYADHRSYGPGEEVPVTLDDREVGRIPVNDVLPDSN